MPRVKPIDPAKQITKACGACHEDFETHRPKASRCPACIAANRRATYRSCFECSAKFLVTAEGQINCPACAAALGLEQYEMSPERREELEAEKRLQEFLQRRDHLLGWLARREAVPLSHHHIHKHQNDLTSLGLI